MVFTWRNGRRLIINAFDFCWRTHDIQICQALVRAFPHSSSLQIGETSLAHVWGHTLFHFKLGTITFSCVRSFTDDYFQLTNSINIWSNFLKKLWLVFSNFVQTLTTTTKNVTNATFLAIERVQKAVLIFFIHTIFILHLKFVLFI